MLTLNHCPKCSPDTGIRIVPPEETLRRVLPLLETAGLGKPEDITGKDDVGIPVFSVDRQETALGVPKYYNGKGVTREQAEASAVMESSRGTAPSSATPTRSSTGHTSRHATS